MRRTAPGGGGNHQRPHSALGLRGNPAQHRPDSHSIGSYKIEPQVTSTKSWERHSITDQLKRDLLEILDDCYDRKSTLTTSQLKTSVWHGAFNNPTLADSIIDRIIHNAYKIDPDGDSIRRLKGVNGLPPKKDATH